MKKSKRLYLAAMLLRLAGFLVVLLALVSDWTGWPEIRVNLDSLVMAGLSSMVVSLFLRLFESSLDNADSGKKAVRSKGLWLIKIMQGAALILVLTALTIGIVSTSPETRELCFIISTAGTLVFGSLLVFERFRPVDSNEDRFVKQ